MSPIPVAVPMAGNNEDNPYTKSSPSHRKKTAEDRAKRYAARHQPPSPAQVNEAGLVQEEVAPAQVNEDGLVQDEVVETAPPPTPTKNPTKVKPPAAIASRPASKRQLEAAAKKEAATEAAAKEAAATAPRKLTKRQLAAAAKKEAASPKKAGAIQEVNPSPPVKKAKANTNKANTAKTDSPNEAEEEENTATKPTSLPECNGYIAPHHGFIDITDGKNYI